MTTEEIVSENSESMEDTIAETMREIQAREEPADEPAVEKPAAARDEAGRFAAKAEPVEAATETAEAAVEPEAPKIERKLPKWNKTAIEKFDALPPEVQAAALKREDDIHAGLTQYRDAATYGTQLKEAIGPREQMLTQNYGSVAAGVKQLLSMSDFAQQNPAAFIKQIAQSRGIDLAALASGEQQPASLQQHPEFRRIAQQAESATQMLQRLQQERERSELSAAQSLITQFAEQHDKDGFLNDSIDSPSGPQAGQFMTTMMSILQTPQAQGMTPDARLQYAYKIACQIDPHASAILSARQQAQAQAAQEKQAVVERARRSQSVNIRQKGSLPSGGAPIGTIEDTLRETLAAFRA